MSELLGTLAELWFILFGPLAGYWLRGIIEHNQVKEHHDTEWTRQECCRTGHRLEGAVPQMGASSQAES
jgi:hypothetical protein